MPAVLTQGASLAEVAIRLTIAVLVGALIGWDREKLDKPAGLRTHMLVALGAASFTLLGFEVSPRVFPSAATDPGRIIQGVVGGIGFMGAGAIIQNRGRVSGVTTAASVWIAGALGTAAGLGAYVLAFVASLLAFLILFAVGKLENSRGRGHGPRAAD